MPAPAPTRLACAQGSFHLKRYPRRNPETLQAWCGADLLLLEAASAQAADTLVVNDEHGALCVAAAALALWTDSALAAQAMRENCERNDLAMPSVIWSTQPPPDTASRVLMRIPKQLRFFEYQLAHLAHCLAPGTTVHFAGMDKHLSAQSATLIERYFGACERHRGRKKARLFTAVQRQRAAPPGDFSSRYYCPQVGADLLSLANGFSREQLDPGARMLLESLHLIDPADSVADLACGNGVLGLAALRAGLAARVTFIDESAMAIAAAKHNSRNTGTQHHSVAFHHGDGLIGVDRRFDLILCNPPFHLGHTVEDFAGRRLLTQCAQALTAQGRLVIVANRHLDYALTLRKSFRKIRRLAENNKFIVWLARDRHEPGA